MPRVFSNNSVPVNLERAHFPERRDELAAGIFRALAIISAIACSAALTIFDVGALITKTFAAVAAGISTLSKPTPARAITFKPVEALIASASIFVAERISTASTPDFSAARSSSRFAPSQ